MAVLHVGQRRRGNGAVSAARRGALGEVDRDAGIGEIRLEIDRPSGPVWLGLEGISGAGKTTQVAALRQHLSRSWDAQVSVTTEFGDDALGRFVASTTGGRRLRLGMGRGETNHARHLLAVTSRVNKMKSAAGGDWDAMLFDVSTLSDVAHALADLDAKADGELRHWLRVGIGPLLQDTAAAVHGVGSTYYLRCRPEIAARRLSGRLGRSLTRKETDFLHRLAAAYDEVVPSTPGVIEIDGEAGRHEVTAEILRSFRSQLDELQA
jgi:thymidylate kinase